MKYAIRNANGTYEGPGSGSVGQLADATLYDSPGSGSVGQLAEQFDLGPGQTWVVVEIERIRLVPPEHEPYRVENYNHGPPLYGANYIWGIRGRDQFNQPAVVAYCDDEVLARRLARQANEGAKHEATKGQQAGGSGEAGPGTSPRQP
jgi:hypothetical protein